MSKRVRQAIRGFALLLLLPLVAERVAAAPAPSEIAAQVIGGATVESLDSGQMGSSWSLATEPIDVVSQSAPPGSEAEDPDAPPARRPAGAPAELWRPVLVPGNLVGQRLVRTGKLTVWYRKLFFLKEIPRRQLAFRLGEISDRDRAFLNGRLIGETGRFDATEPFAYDRTRLYEIPLGILRPGVNVLLVQVQGYFDWELGIYRDRTAIGPAESISRELERENARQVYILMIYLSVGSYFLFLFVRRRTERENLFFALFALALVAYHFLRTQFKFDLGFTFVTLKQFQYLNLFSFAPLFYYFVRSYHRDLPPFWPRIWDRVMIVATAAYAAVAAALLLFEIHVWESVNQSVMQLGFWPIYSLSIGAILAVRSYQKDRDAWIMLGGLAVMMVAIVLDVLSSQGRINLPTTLNYAFIIFVLGMALILANRFVRMHEQVRSLNVDLSKTNHAYSRFVPREFLSQLGRQSIIDVEIGDQVRRRMTILFSDIRSFTSLSETMSPEENFNFLNSYLKHMTPLVQSNNGFIDKYIGDAIMALFPENPEDAVRAAVAMQKDIDHYNQIRVRDGKKPIEVGIGLHTGNLMLGTIGAEDRMEGTVISDAVNLASRIEGVTKIFGAGICVSGTALEVIPSYEQKYHVRFLGNLQVKGKLETVPIYEVYDGAPDNTFRMKAATIDLYKRGLAAYQEQRFAESVLLFDELLAAFPTDLAARFYRDEAQRLVNTGVEPAWKPVVKLDSK